MRSTGRTGRILCFTLSVLLLIAAVFLLTDAVQVDTEPQATKLIVLAQVLATGSVALMIGALVWTLAARARPEDRGSGHAPHGYGGGPAQEAWVPPPGQAHQTHGAQHPHGPG